MNKKTITLYRRPLFGFRAGATGIATVAKTAAAVAALGLLLAACGRDAATAPGITADTVKIGGSLPLSGALSANGLAQVAGAQAYFKAVNDAGGVAFSDGKKRKIEYIAHDDAYDPGKLVVNFRQLVNQDKVLAVVGSFGTPGNLAVMPETVQLGVPNIFLVTGASVFSAEPAKNPWTIGWLPTYESEGKAFAEFIKAQGKPARVAVLSQNDDVGKAYVRGLEKELEGSQAQIVARQTYEPTDPTVDSQILNLAASKADWFFSAVNVPRLQASGLKQIQLTGWKPATFVPTLTSNIAQVIKPSGAGDYFSELRSTTFIKAPASPQFANDPDVVEYLARMAKYSPGVDPNILNAVWGYASAETMVESLKAMKPLSRQGLMDAVHGLKLSKVSMLLPGIGFDGGQPPQAPITGFKLQTLRNGAWVVSE
ncbi:MAG: ABC transporter substrate-binding protein [Rhodoferax sp.]|nr:ABC transporter substrate-binding protein [Rhodoferax sp.]